MLKIDKTIHDICTNISTNIDKLQEDSGLLAQNVLGQLRNLVESIISKIYIEENNLGDIDGDFDKTINPGKKYVKSKSKYKIISDFYNSLKISVSHYTLDQNNSERLIIKYIEHLIKTKDFLKVKFGFDVLNNLSEFPINKNKDLYEYYFNISTKIDKSYIGEKDSDYADRYYISKKKPFFIRGKIYYEVTAVEARDKFSKFDRFIFYTRLDINPYYAIKIKIKKDLVICNGMNIPIIIVNDYQVAIRPCEIDNYARILGISVKINTANKDYYYLTRYLKESNYSICDIINFESLVFDAFIAKVEENSRTKSIINILSRSREIISKNLKGSNVLLYLLLNLNNKVIKNQSIYKYSLVSENRKLSNLYLHNGCIPFDEMPFCTSPIGNNPSLVDLFEIIDPKDREHELLARFIKNKAEKEKQIYTEVKDLMHFDNYEELIEKYNSKLYGNLAHQYRSIEIYKNHAFISSYDKNISFILKESIKLGSSGIENYSNSVQSWQIEDDYKIDSQEKQEAMLNAFNTSRLFVIYGAAGTGKTTMLNHFANLFHNKKKVFLSNTYSSLENLKRRIKVSKSNFYSVKKYIYNLDRSSDILFIDECSTISNEDMKDILTQSTFKLLVLAGDTYQIESINFGNWFDILMNFIRPESYIELKVPHRTENKELITLWDKVRNKDSNMMEYFAKGKYCYPIESTIFDTTCDNEIILCLNYDGLYGINNVNRLLQQKNPNTSYFIGLNEYKINDPVLFNENSEKYEPLLYNNAKGKIVDIKDVTENLIFQIELDKSINELDLVDEIRLVGLSENSNSIIQFKVSKVTSSDEDNAISAVPFNVAYAVSIHKSQGLEYDSVKVIIVDEIEEMITHNIFYTAITRTKNYLRIYWSANTQNTVLKSFIRNVNHQDSNIISYKHSLDIVK